MEKKWFVALLMVVVMMCACWTGAVAEDEERETFTVGDYEYALLDDGTVEITNHFFSIRTTSFMPLSYTTSLHLSMRFHKKPPAYPRYENICSCSPCMCRTKCAILCS